MFQDGAGGGPTERHRPKVPTLGSTPAPSRRAVGEHCEQSTPVGRTRKGRRPEPEGGHGRSSAAPAGRLPTSFNVDWVDANYSPVLWPPDSRSWRYARGKCTGRDAPARKPVLGIGTPRAARPRRVEFLGPNLRIHPFASRRFHVLLNSLFKVLFNFPSRYLSAIGLVSVFSLRWSLPPALGCIPKQPDSEDAQSYRVRCL